MVKEYARSKNALCCIVTKSFVHFLFIFLLEKEVINFAWSMKTAPGFKSQGNNHFLQHCKHSFWLLHLVQKAGKVLRPQKNVVHGVHFKSCKLQLKVCMQLPWLSHDTLQTPLCKSTWPQYLHLFWSSDVCHLISRIKGKALIYGPQLKTCWTFLEN